MNRVLESTFFPFYIWALGTAAALLLTFGVAGGLLDLDSPTLIKWLLSACLGLFIAVFATNIQRTHMTHKKFEDLKNFFSDDSTKYLGDLDDFLKYLDSNGP